MQHDPLPTRPKSPGYGGYFDRGDGLLPWSWALEHFAPMRSYWLATTRPDGRPHVMPVWGVWLDGVFLFSTSPNSLKGRNLASKPRCAVTNMDEAASVVVEGTAAFLQDAETLARFNAAYEQKYDWKMDTTDPNTPVYVLRPTVAFGMVEGEGQTGSPTKWVFDQA